MAVLRQRSYRSQECPYPVAGEQNGLGVPDGPDGDAQGTVGLKAPASGNTRIPELLKTVVRFGGLRWALGGSQQVKDVGRHEHAAPSPVIPGIPLTAVERLSA